MPVALELLALAPGEETKSLSELGRVLDFLAEHRLDRTSVLVAIGGGILHARPVAGLPRLPGRFEAFPTGTANASAAASEDQAMARGSAPPGPAGSGANSCHSQGAASNPARNSRRVASG